MLARCDIRRRWVGACALILLTGLVSAVVLVTVAGARRTESSLRRFNDSSRAAEVTLLPPFGYTPTASEVAALRRVANVTAVGELRSFAVVPTNAPATLTIAAARDGAVGTLIDRDRLVRGRRPRPDATNEVAISESLAKMMRQGIGGHLDAVSFTPAQVQSSLALGAPPPMGDGHRLRWRIVGIVRRPLDLGTLATQGGVVTLTPAFDHANATRIGNFGELIRIRTIHGVSDVPEVVDAARKVFAESGGALSAQGTQTEIVGAQNAIDVLTTALRIFALVVAIAAVITIAILLSREMSLANDERDTLRTVGVTRVQRVLVNGPRALLIAISGGLLAVVGAIAASPLLPIGIARQADPDPGYHADWLVLLSGLVVVVVIVVLIAVVAALRNDRRSAPHAVGHPGIVGRTSTRLRPVPATGLRMALEPGRGRTAVPVRSACFGATFGVLGIVAVLVFGASLHRLVTTPGQYGRTWDFTVPNSSFNPTTPDCATESFGMTKVAGIGALAAICDNDVQLDGRPVTAWGITPVRGTITPTIIKGRAPRSAGEVALGAKTLDALGKHIGEPVHGRNPHGTVTYKIVGQVAMPTLATPQPLADGAVLTGPGLMRIYDGNSRASRNLVGRYTPGGDPRTVSHAIAKLDFVGAPTHPIVPVEIDRIRKVDWIPATLAGLLALLALIAIGHALVTTVRRRRHDLAILRTIGFTPHQARSTIAWQATLLAAIGLAGGIPLGIIVGRAAWTITAESLGVATINAIPTVALLIVIPSALIAANALAYTPAHTAARINPAAALRSE